MTTAVPVSRARAWTALVGLALPLFALSVDAYGVGILLPDIAHDLDISELEAAAVITASAIGCAAPLLLAGRLADRVGSRRLLLVGVALFVISSAICAAAGSFGVLVGGRLLQGLSSACCFTTSLAVIDAMFDDDRRPAAVGIWAAIGGIGGAMGPLVASALASLWSWRAFFTVNVGFGAAAFVVLAVVVPHFPGDRSRELQARRLAVLAVGLAAAVGALQHAAGAGWGRWSVTGIVVGGVLLVVAAAPRDRGPLVSPTVMRQWSFRAGTAVATTSNWGSGVIFTLVPPALTAVRHTSLLETGVLFLAFSGPFALGGAVSGPAVRLLREPRASAVSSAVQGAGLIGLGVVGLAAPLALVVVGLAIAGFGNGVVYSTATSLALTDVPEQGAGEASGVLTMWRLVGLTIGVALSSMLVDALSDTDRLRDASGVDVALIVAGVIALLGVLTLRGAPGGRR